MQGHPARIARKKRHAEQTPEEQALYRRLRQAVREDDPIKGPLTVAAERMAPQLQEHCGLEGEEHRAAIVAYLVGCFGEVFHAFPDNPEFLPPYLQHREESVARVRKALAEAES